MPEADGPSFEDALADLERVVRRLEDGQIKLDDALADYEKGVGLLRHCHRLLEQAEQRVVALTGADEMGQAILRPFDDGEAS